MRIGNVNLEKQALVVAEIGNNHEGRFDVAQELVRQAAVAGVHAVKFQTFRTDYYVSRSDLTRFNRLKSFELSHNQFVELAELAHSLGLAFISTPFDLESARFLLPIVDAIKIASGDNNFYPLIDVVAQSRKPLIISSGVSDLAQVKTTFEFVKSCRHGRELDLSFLHCVSSYPVPVEETNLLAIPFLIEQLGLPVGYSDHTLGIDASVIAVALGARIIEKHFTIDKAFSDFRDHQLSADPDEMKKLVEKVKLTSAMLGTYAKNVQPCESAMPAMIRRSIVAGRDLKAGHVLVYEDLTWIRPSGGEAPGEEQKLIGRILKRDMTFGEPLRMTDVI